MGKLVDIDDFYKRYMFHVERKAEAEFNQIIREIKKTEEIPKASNEIHSNNNHLERMTFYEAIETIKGNKWIACSEKYQEAMNLIETTISKYQKIQEAMDSRPDDSAKSNSKALSEIEVIMYGNDDN